MLKGHVFKEQIFGNQVFAYFIDTFLNKKCGIGNYKNKMEVTFSGSNVTIQSGLACIRGRFIEEDTYTQINAGTESYFCKLIIEVDLDKENTEEQLNQVYYKIVKDTNNYPTLTQTDIVANNSGIYQYELARFKTSASGISEFQDMRTYLDFDSIYAEIEKEYRSVLQSLQQELEDTTKNYLRKSEDIVVILHYVAEKNDVDTIEYPKNFNMHNTVVLSVIEDANKGEYWKTADFHNDGIALTHHLASVELHSTNIKIQGNRDTYYRITLMRF